MANAIYWKFLDLAHVVYNDLDNKNLVFVGIFRNETYEEVRCVDKHDVKEPHKPIHFEAIIAHPLVMGELLRYGYREAREEYIDDATR